MIACVNNKLRLNKFLEPSKLVQIEIFTSKKFSAFFRSLW